MNLNDLRMSLKAALDNMWARIDARITAIEQGGVGGVTGVKGNAEASYRQGNVNLTPADIGAVAKAGDTMTGPLTISNSLNVKEANASDVWSVIDFTSVNNNYTGQVAVNHNDYYVMFKTIKNNIAEYFVLPTHSSTVDAVYNILTTKSPVTIPQGGTGATGVETSRIVIHSSLSGLGVPASLNGNNNWLRRWGKLYVLTYSVDISQFTFQPASQWVRLVQDEEGWLNNQFSNAPWEVDIDKNIANGKLIYGTLLSLGQGWNYPASQIRVNITWLDPN